MTPEQAFGKLNKDIKGLTSGVASTSVSGSSIIFTMNDGSTQTITFPQPKDGASIIAVSTNENNQFVFSMSDGTEIVGGEVPTSSGVSKEYVDTELAKKANTSDIPSLDGYVTEEVLDTKGYLTSHQDISNLIEKEDVYETLKLGYINSGSIKDFLLSDAKVGTYVVAPDVTDMPFGKYWWRINVEKPKSNDTSFKATATLLGKNSAIYYMIYNSADKNFYNGWTKIAVTRVEDVNWTTVDISSNEENTSTGATLNYCIKNGICYMSILNIGFKTETQAIILGANSVPKSSSDYCWCPLVGVADPSYSVLVHPTIYGGLEHHVVRSTSLVYSGLFSYPVAET